MRGRIGGPSAKVYLSERNLRSLLAELSIEGSHCTIECAMTDGGVLSVTAERDDPHYGDRTPGPMHPDTEAAILVAARENPTGLFDKARDWPVGRHIYLHGGGRFW